MRETLAANQQHSRSSRVGDPAGKSGSGHGHSLDMLARTAVSAHSPNLDRFTSGNTFTAATGTTNPHSPSLRASVSDSSSSWSPDGNSIDPIERRWLDIEDARALFDRSDGPHAIIDLLDSGETCFQLTL